MALYYFMSVSKLDTKASTAENPVYISNIEAEKALLEVVQSYGENPPSSKLIQLKVTTGAKLRADGWFVGLVYNIIRATKSELTRLESTLLASGHILDEPTEKGYARVIRIGMECTPD